MTGFDRVVIGGCVVKLCLLPHGRFIYVVNGVPPLSCTWRLFKKQTKWERKGEEEQHNKRAES